MTQLEHDIKALIIDSLGLEDIEPKDIPSDQPLFGDGLGLDSVDALELALALQKRFALKIDPDAKDTRDHFATVATLAAFVIEKRNQQEA
ncbi:acyl carrier protein [Pigmentiphaga aceris]|uniref:Acyl carrier protein n=1 Tax=Pigmentiphaga aceris TaxID=1940612 RepID=A0A5C0B0Z2_9BURK|nr:phosphopantetheine-binding protein [Pigmentiphaga aceris]QEI07626.1 acyl carrier protein [Pigmentiphaga aceris]